MTDQPPALAAGYHLGSCASTQPLAAAWAASDLDSNAQVVAVLTDAQEQGLGRDGRTWTDGPGENLLLSVGFRGPFRTSLLDGLALRFAGVVSDVINERCAIESRVKEPNDLVVGDRKLGGLLVDARTVGEVVQRVAVGIGCNLGGARFVTIDGREATTVEAEGGAFPEARQLADKLVPLFSAVLDVELDKVKWQQPARLWLALRDGEAPGVTT